jgi:hypothetical protein
MTTSLRTGIGSGRPVARTSTAAAVLVLVAACGAGGEAAPATELTPPPSVPTDVAASGDDVTVTTLPSDEAVLTRSGSTAIATGISGRYGPEYVLYARCRGQGALKVTGAGSGPWVAPCDGVPSRVRVLTEDPAVSLRLTVAAGTKWNFVVARSKAAPTG